MKSKPDGGKFGRFKVVGTRTSDVVAHICATSSFGSKMRIEIVRGDRIETAVSCLRHLSFGEEEKMRFSGGEVVLHRLKIRTKATDVAEIYIEKIVGSVKIPGVVSCRTVRCGGTCGPPPRLGTPRFF